MPLTLKHHFSSRIVKKPLCVSQNILRRVWGPWTGRDPPFLSETIITKDDEILSSNLVILGYGSSSPFELAIGMDELRKVRSSRSHGGVMKENQSATICKDPPGRRPGSGIHFATHASTMATTEILWISALLFNLIKGRSHLLGKTASSCLSNAQQERNP